MRLDLHIHTTASDGAWTPAAVVDGAAAGRLDVIAIADHDTTAAVESAVERGRVVGVRVIPAIEVSSTWEGREIHVLGYFVDPASEVLIRHGARARTLRRARLEEMVARLALQGIDVDFDEVLRTAGAAASSLSRPHLARVLVDGGHASSVYDAFDRLIGDNHEAFVPTMLQTPTEAIAVIHDAGGIAVWAHPPADLVEPLLDGLVTDGLGGLEVHRPGHRNSVTKRLAGLCRQHGLLPSGGSDWHSPDAGHTLGDFYVTGGQVSRLMAAGDA